MTALPTILLLSPNGQVGWELNRCASPLGQLVTAGRRHGDCQLDFSNIDKLRHLIQEIKPHIILNAAAYTGVDKAEEEPSPAMLLNAELPGMLAEVAQQYNALLVHYSTDYVFDGSATTPYAEQAVVNPLGVYGESKLKGEQAIQAVGGHYLIFRTAWVYGARGKNFMLTMQRLAKTHDRLTIVADQWGAPTWSRMIAQATVQVLAQLQSPLYRTELATLSGIYHLTCGGKTNWYEFAKTIIAAGDRHPEIVPITTADYPTPAQRPAYSVLANDTLQTTFGVTLPDWETALTLCLAEQAAV